MDSQEIQLSADSIVHIIMQSLLFMIGLPIQFKIMYVSWKDKEAKTWQIHLTHSFACTIYYLFVIPFWHISTSKPHLAAVTGEWVCYINAFVTLYGFFIITLNSLLIAVTKYMFIVHHDKMMRLGERNAQKMFMGVNLIVPLVLTTITGVNKHFYSLQTLTSCFGMREEIEEIKVKYNTWDKGIERYFLCNLYTTEKDIMDAYILYVIKQCLCALKSIVVLLINTNIPEAFFYYKIFRKMKR